MSAAAEKQDPPQIGWPSWQAFLAAGAGMPARAEPGFAVVWTPFHTFDGKKGALVCRAWPRMDAVSLVGFER